jgi:hypothetical protein
MLLGFGCSRKLIFGILDTVVLQILVRCEQVQLVWRKLLLLVCFGFDGVFRFRFLLYLLSEVFN